ALRQALVQNAHDDRHYHQRQFEDDEMTERRITPFGAQRIAELDASHSQIYDPCQYQRAQAYPGDDAKARAQVIEKSATYHVVLPPDSRHHGRQRRAACRPPRSSPLEREW